MKKYLIFVVFLTFVALAFAQAGDYFESEGNNTIAEADPIDMIGYYVDIYGTLLDVSDVDWFAYYVNGGDNLTVSVVEPEFFNVSIYDSFPALLTQIGFTPDIYTYDYIAVESGLVRNYLEVSSAAGYIGPYHVRIVNHTSPTLLPVELSSFTALVTSENFVQLEWITQSETDMLGYNILRGQSDEAQTALQVNAELIPAHNQSAETIYSAIDNDVAQNNTYWYWLESIELDGETALHGPISVTLVPGAPDDEEVPDGVFTTALLGNFPNPFNPSTSVVYTLANESTVEIAIYNIRGELVRQYNETQSQGRHSVVWNGKDDAGNTCTSGVYFFHFRTDTMEQVSKGILLK